MAILDSSYDALFRQTRSLLVALGYRDLSTRLHSDRVRDLCAVIGDEYGLTEDELYILKIGASFHDIGKIGMPDHILLKASQYDEDDWEVMRLHVEVGEKILLSTELEGSKQVSLAIRHHHEYYDGKGYPEGLTADEIPICSRIISVADSYDAMAETRPYHRAKPHSEIMDILRSETGHKHDPRVMSIFCEIIEHSEFKSADREDGL